MITEIDKIRNRIIDKLLTIDNPELLEAYNKILQSISESPLVLSEPQIEMLKMSDEDIKSGRTISQNQIDKEDAKWLD